MFNSISGDSISEIVEKKSKFIANMYYIESVEEAENKIKEINKKYFDARHNCYAFSVMTENGVINRFSDDGEPSGTAGAPMLNILTSQNICNVLIIVTRYFGGILLGTGGLVKAYTTASIEALNKVNIINKDLGIEVRFTVEYSDLEKLKYYLKQNNVNITNIEYFENVNVTTEMTNEKLDLLLEQKENLNFKIIENEILRKKIITI